MRRYPTTMLVTVAVAILLVVPTGRSLGKTPNCEDARTCVGDYYGFIEKAAEHARPVPKAEILRRIEALRGRRIPPGIWLLEEIRTRPWALRWIIKYALNIEFLISGEEAPPPTVTIVESMPGKAWHEERILFDDYWVGAFSAQLLLPAAEGFFPGLLFLHGHGQEIATFRSSSHAEDFVRKGWAVLLISFRAMDLTFPAEGDISWELLEKGFTLIGLRVYEATIALDYLRGHPQVDGDRIGVMGHSGGGSVGNLLARLDDQLTVYVTDHHKPYLDLGGEDGTVVHCETVPALYPYDMLINDFSTLTIPYFLAEYGCDDGCREDLDAFLEEHL